MATPLRKDQPEFEPDEREELEHEEITSGDVLQGKRQMSDTLRENVRDVRGPQPVADERLAAERSVAASSVPSVPGTPEDPSVHLFPNDEMQDLRTRWKAVQAAFVDDPRRAVQQADGLVTSATQRLADVFSEERSRLEQQWHHGDNVSTEDLRVALQRYRTFFERLLSI